MRDKYREEFLREAIRLAQENVQQGQGGPFGAVVVRGNQIIARGVNRVTANRDPTAHAEIEAIRSACWELEVFSLEGCTLYTSCEPCPMCLAAIYWAHLGQIFYAATRQDAAEAGFDDARLYEEMSRPLPQRTVPITQHCRNEAQTVFAFWRARPDAVPY